MTDKSKTDMVPPAPTNHPDSRMHLTLDDLRPLMQDDPKITYPLVYSNPGKVK